jgi:hypothetical protein
LFGGEASGRLADTWEFDGATWTELQVAAPYPGRTGHAMIYDAARGRFVAFGGYSSGSMPLEDTWTLRYVPMSAAEACTSNVDYDNDGFVGCDDDECWGVCTPGCLPLPMSTTCAASPACGDGTCTGTETCRSCPADCAVGTTECPILCGDYLCDSSESVTSCPGDCTP